MESPAPHRMSLPMFRSRARAVRLHNHGREWEIFLGTASLGFADGPEHEAVDFAHRREVNNALYAHTEPTPGLSKPELPTAEALAYHPELISKFPAAVALMPTLQKAADIALDVLDQQTRTMIHVYTFNQPPAGEPQSSSFHRLDRHRGWNYLTPLGRQSLLEAVAATPERIRAVFVAWASEYDQFDSLQRTWQFLARDARVPTGLHAF